MRAVVQRVTSATVVVSDSVVGAIGPGLCAFVGVCVDDDGSVAERMADRLWRLRVFEDEAGKMNRSAADLDLAVLVVSQFTLCSNTSRGHRPSFTGAASADQAEPLVEQVVSRLAKLGATVATGRFRTDMAVTLTNDGPVTVVLDV